MFENRWQTIKNLVGAVVGVVDEMATKPPGELDPDTGRRKTEAKDMKKYRAERARQRKAYTPFYKGVIQELATRYLQEKEIKKQIRLLADYRQVVFDKLRKKYGKQFGDEMEELYYKVLDKVYKFEKYDDVYRTVFLEGREYWEKVPFEMTLPKEAPRALTLNQLHKRWQSGMTDQEFATVLRRTASSGEFLSFMIPP